MPFVLKSDNSSSVGTPRGTGRPAREQLVEELWSLYSPVCPVTRRVGRWVRRESSRRALWLRTRGYHGAKRAIDIAGSAALLLVLSPLLGLLALLIKLGDGGPVFFRQKRVGRYGEVFDFPKFRSMVVDAEKVRAKLLALNDHGRSVTFKMKRDPRVTPVGRVMRRFSLDELPQLWCVLSGHMSLVGPRPPLPQEVAKYRLEHRRRLDVIPGLTCIWQVSGRGDIAFEQQCEMDVEYVETQSLGRDLALLFQTIPAVLSGRGAY